MRKFAVLLFTVFMIFSLEACAGNNAGNGTVQNTGTTEAETLNSNMSISTNAETEGTEASNSAQTDTAQVENSVSSDGGSVASKILVAYFSATNTTEGVAKNIADSLSADLYEITPANPYTSADLDYHNDKSRSTIEMNDPSARPAISGSVANMAQYDIVFIGYPIWWGDAPRILSTFIESYNFSGKTVVPFCTSGGSGIGSSASNLENLTTGATWLSGTRLNGSASRSSVVEWINGLGLNVTAQ